MERLEVRLLGTPRIQRAGLPVRIELRKSLALLAYLAVTGRSHRRDALAALLWPDLGEERGHAALRSTLYALNRLLPPPALEASRDEVRLTVSHALWVDVQELRARVAEAARHDHGPTERCAACVESLSDVAALYGGDFLEGFSLKDSAAFDDWQFLEGEALRRELSDALQGLIDLLCAACRFVDAIPYARRLLSLDPLDERVHSKLMLLFAWSGQRSEAIRQYQQCARSLREEIDTDPLDSTRDLYEAIRAGAIPEPPARRGQATPAQEVEPRAPGEPPPARTQATRYATILCLHVKRAPGTSPTGPEATLFGALGAVAARGAGVVDRVSAGSAMLAFGSVHTGENDPELAARVAVELRGKAEAAGVPLGQGISSGNVAFVRAAPPRQDWTVAMGRVSDQAQRLARVAGPGQILAADSTRRLTRAAFAFTRAPPEGTGQTERDPAYRLERLLAEPRKARGVEGLTSELVGRDYEMAKLREALERVEEGEGQLVALVGGPGVGKSRLVAELRALSKTRGAASVRWLEGRCLSAGTTVGYEAFLGMLAEQFRFPGEATAEERGRRIAQQLREMARLRELPVERLEDTAAAFGGLLSARFANAWDQTLAHAPPEQVKQRTFHAVRDVLSALARRGPVALVFEDLHWADALSIDLVCFLVEALETLPLLMLCTFRPERGHDCLRLSNVAGRKCPRRFTELTLRDLGPEDSLRLLRQLLKTEDLGQAQEERILAASQGNPFFLEEVIRSLLDSGRLLRSHGVWKGSADTRGVEISGGVLGVILGRVEELRPELQRTLCSASVLGTSFDRQLLAAILDRPKDLDGLLGDLEERSFVFKDASVPVERYTFYHVLMREAVYQGMPDQQRRSLHGTVARLLEQRYADDLDGQSELLAHHFDMAGDAAKAIDYLFRAARRAVGRYANKEAFAHLSRGLEILASTRHTRERDRRELEFLVASLVPLIILKGHANQEVETACARAMGLCGKVGEQTETFQVLLGLRRFYLMRGRFKEAIQTNERMTSLARAMGDRMRLSRAYMLGSEVLWWWGDFPGALAAANRGLEAFSPESRRAHLYAFGNDTEMGTLVTKAAALWHLGYPEQARAATLLVFERLEEVRHPFSAAMATYYAANVYQFLREPAEVLRLCRMVMEVSDREGFVFHSGIARILAGWAQACLGDDAGFPAAVRAVAEWEATGVAPVQTYCSLLLAEAALRTRRMEEGAAAIEHGLALSRRTGEGAWRAELLRLKGELALTEGEEPAGAEQCFQRALTWAGDHGARSQELRAATSLSRLWLRQKRKDAARDLMQRVYGTFTEGFQTVDLREAAALLARIG